MGGYRKYKAREIGSRNFSWSSLTELTVRIIGTFRVMNPNKQSFAKGQNRSTDGCSKLKSPETKQVQERSVSTLEHMQVPK